MASNKRHDSPRCHGLAPWRLTFVATNKRHDSPRLAANVSLHGARPWHLQEPLDVFSLVANVSLHGARPWHQSEFHG